MFQRRRNQKEKKLSEGKETGQSGEGSNRKSRKNDARKVFGFPCSPVIAGRIRMLADRFNVPIFAIAEHALEIACELLDLMLKDPQQSALLRRHVLEGHSAVRTIEKMDAYDQNMADIMQTEWQRRYRIETVAIRLVAKYLGRGVKPEDVEFYIEYGIKAWNDRHEK